MASKRFQFKQFSVAQDLCTHKVGTDGVLLGAWVRLNEADDTMLDVGTGSGVIALMLAQRSPTNTRIDAVEIEPVDVAQAKANVLQSPWKEKVVVHHSSIQQFFPAKEYDLIVSNPPFFVNSWLPPEKKRSHARHTLQLPYEELLTHATRLLKRAGRLALILPQVEALRFVDLALQFQLHPIRKTAFRARPHKPVERLLLELAYSGVPEPDSEIILYSQGDEWSEDYKRVTRNFYLNS